MKLKIENDPHRIQEIQNSIVEGELILKTGRYNNRKLFSDELEIVKKSVENARAKIETQN